MTENIQADAYNDVAISYRSTRLPPHDPAGSLDMYDDDQEAVEPLYAAQPIYELPGQLFNEEDEEDNQSYVRGYN